MEVITIPAREEHQFFVASLDHDRGHYVAWYSSDISKFAISHYSVEDAIGNLIKRYALKVEHQDFEE